MLELLSLALSLSLSLSLSLRKLSVSTTFDNSFKEKCHAQDDACKFIFLSKGRNFIICYVQGIFLLTHSLS